MPDSAHKWRIIVATGFMVLCMIGLGTRLAFLHLGLVAQAEPLEQGRSYQRTLDGETGKIFDRRGRENILACDRILKDIWVDPRRIREMEAADEVVNALASLNLVPRSELVERGEP